MGLMSITAPIDKYEAFEDWPRLQRLAFNVLSSRCYYFDIAHAFVKIPMTEGNSLSTVSSIHSIRFVVLSSSRNFARVIETVRSQKQIEISSSSFPLFTITRNKLREAMLITIPPPVFLISCAC